MTESRLYPARPFLAASVAVIRDGQVLLAARAAPPLQNRFTLPGGLVEPGESLAEAALRELDEEVGVTARITGVLAPVEIIDRDEEGRVRGHFVVIAHTAHWLAGEPRPGPEARAVCWASPADIPRLPLTPGLAPLLERAFALADTGASHHPGGFQG